MRTYLVAGVAATLTAAAWFGMADGGATPIETQAAALAPAEASTAARIVALHQFVRDEIREVPTRRS